MSSNTNNEGEIRKRLIEEDLVACMVALPGRYVGAPDQEDDGEPFADKMARLTGQLKGQFEESDRLEAAIRCNLGGLGYEC